MASIKNVTELDFDQIKDNLKIFLSAQDKFNDYDFDGSGLNVLLDVLAYNTQYNALLAHMSANETFLDSSQLRQNVVSHAKSLGYLPRSVRCSDANMKLVVTGDSQGPAELQIPRGTTFNGAIGSKQFTFVTNVSHKASKDVNNQYTYDSVIAKEGALKSITYRVTGNEFQKFRISDKKIDTSTLSIRVRSSLTSADYQTYNFFQNINDITATSFVYFIQENSYGEYEFYFGDGVLGYKPAIGQIVELSYISTNGVDGNGAKAFTINSSIGGYTSIVVQPATGFIRTSTGTNVESINSIKYNAPKVFSTQNRAVTAQDYRSLLLSEYDFIEDISIWGGETAEPPVYGKVYISIKPIDSEYLSQRLKRTIYKTLKLKNIGSVTPEFLDPDYTFVTMDVLFKFNPNESSNSKVQLESLVLQGINDYNNTILEKYDGVLRHSNILSLIDNTDAGILNSTIRLKMHKHLVPITGLTSNYNLKFSSPIYTSINSEEVITSSTFTYEGTTCKFTDIATEAVGFRKILILDTVTNNIVNNQAGIINTATGLVSIVSIIIESTDDILIYCSPDSNDIAPKFNQLVSIDFTTGLDGLPGVNVAGEEDGISVLGSTASSTYNTFPRHG